MDLSINYREIQAQIEAACQSVNRSASEITLIAVSKTHPLESILTLYDLGHRDFGENRFQEARPKIEALPKDIRWHFIGHLQSNKAKAIGESFSFVHTLSTPSALTEFNKCPGTIEVLIEVNIANEPQKSGLSEKSLDEFVATVIQYPKVHFRGLMTVGPIVEKEAIRPLFRQLRQLNETFGGDCLSMGMSENFDVAIQEGATHIRVGSALFGSRSQ